MNPSINTDVLVIGSGLSSTTAAITAADEGKNVTIMDCWLFNCYNFTLGGIFFKDRVQKMFLLIGWAFSSGVTYMALFINLEPIPTTIKPANVEAILPLVALALIVSLLGVVLTIIDSKN